MSLRKSEANLKQILDEHFINVPEPEIIKEQIEMILTSNELKDPGKCIFELVRVAYEIGYCRLGDTMTDAVVELMGSDTNPQISRHYSDTGTSLYTPWAAAHVERIENRKIN